MSTTNPSPPSKPTPAQKAEATSYLTSLLNKNLRVTTTDGRMFWGTFKCTDPESNLVLQHTYEYRPPTAQQVSDAAATASGPGSRLGLAENNEHEAEAGDPRNGAEGGKKDKVKLDMTSRYLGLVVVPGQYIVRIEVEEFASQMRGRQTRVLGVGEQAGGGFGMGGGVAVGVS